MASIRSVCVYCGSSPGRGSDYLDAGRILGEALAHAGLRLVYGGGTRGVMGAVAAGVMNAGGEITGVIPRFLMNKEATEAALERLDDLVVTEDMHARKHTMFEKSDAFVALPGGIGTVEELVEIMTWAQLGRHRKPIALANINRFWDPLLGLFDHMRSEGFLHNAERLNPVVVDKAEELVPAILEAVPPDDASGEEAVIERM